MERLARRGVGALSILSIDPIDRSLPGFNYGTTVHTSSHIAAYNTSSAYFATFNTLRTTVFERYLTTYLKCFEIGEHTQLYVTLYV